MSGDLRAALTGVERDISALRRLLEALTNALRDGAISFAGHDKAQSDLKGHLMLELEAIRERLSDLDADLQNIRRLQDDARDAHEDFADVGEMIQKNRDLLLELAGLVPSLNPPPLIRNFQEMLELVREVADRDPVTGKPVAGMALWAPMVRKVFLAGVATAALALAYKLLGPLLSWAPPPTPHVITGKE